MNQFINSELITKHFPAGFTPRENQRDALNDVHLALSKKKFIVLIAPTGSGKSIIAQTLANSSKHPTKHAQTYINDGKLHVADKSYHSEGNSRFGSTTLTVTKSLQDQYKDLFSDIEILKGKGSYRCDLDTNYTVDIARCTSPGSSQKRKCIACNKCTYYNDVESNFISLHSVQNYSKFFSNHIDMKYREYIICDEASELEDELVSRFSVSLKFKALKALSIKVPGSYNLSNGKKSTEWLGAVRGVYEKALDDAKKSNKTASGKLSAIQNTIQSIETTLRCWDKGEYIVEFLDDEVKFVPIRVDRLAQEELFAYGDKVILMSATIIDPLHYCKQLGIKKSEVEVIEVPSSFDAANAPIVQVGDTGLNNKNLQGNMVYIVKTILKLCELHQGQKGLIHSQTLNIGKAIKSVVGVANTHHDFLFREGQISNEQILYTHSNTDRPTVLVSPSMTHGVDLKGKLAEFQIVVKAPYAPLGDARTKELFARDKQWYTNKMLSTFVQQCGRGVRTEEDRCITYIIDANICKTVVRECKRLPSSFLERFQ